MAHPALETIFPKAAIDKRGESGIHTDMNSLSHLMALIDAYGVLTGIADVTLSSRMFGDSKKIAQLRAGSDITTSRLDKAVRWFSERWPDGAEWPKGIDRPCTNVQAAE